MSSGFFENDKTLHRFVFDTQRNEREEFARSEGAWDEGLEPFVADEVALEVQLPAVRPVCAELRDGLAGEVVDLFSSFSGHSHLRHAVLGKLCQNSPDNSKTICPFSAVLALNFA